MVPARRMFAVVRALLVFAGAASLAGAQCAPGFTAISAPGLVAGLGAPVEAVAAANFGAGPVAAFGGHFTTAGGIAASRLAFFDGQQWSTAGVGCDGAVRALVAADLGQGPALYLGGDFSAAGGVAAAHAARYDGVSFAPLGAGLNGAVRAFAVFDDGGGPKLYAGGAFTAADGAPAARVARFDGASWSAVGLGFDGEVSALAVFDDGAGPKLYAGGAFTLADGAPASGLARFDGFGWSGFGGGLAPATGGATVEVAALTAGDAGDGPRLFVGGAFGFAGGVAVANLAAWDGVVFSSLGAATLGVRALALHATGGATRLAVAATFLDGTGSPTVGVLWRAGDAATPQWTVIASLGTPLTQSARTLCSLSTAGPPTLVLAGDFSAVSSPGAGVTPANHAAQWNGVRFSPFGAGLAGTIRRLKAVDCGGGPVLYAGGYFALGGGFAARTPGGFAALAPDLVAPTVFGVASHVADVVAFDSGNGLEPHVVGYFQTAGGVWLGNTARLTPGGWQPLGTGVNGFAYAAAVFDDGAGPALYVGGGFSTAGGSSSQNLARWTGTAWQAVGGLNGSVGALHVYDDGSGPALYAAGAFTTAGGAPAPGAARFRNGAWSPLPGGGLTAPLALGGFAGRSLVVFDAGAGPRLYFGGNFQFAGGVFSPGLARFGPQGFEAAGGGLGGPSGAAFEISLAPFATSAGPRLAVSGPFSTAGGAPAPGMAFFDGAFYAAPGTAGGPIVPQGTTTFLAAYDDGDGARLYAGGGGAAFSGGVNVARFTDPAPGFLVAPQGTSAPVGAAATFRLAPAGDGPFSIQWRRNGAPIPGAVGPELVLIASGIADGGLVDATITNACGTAVSAPVPWWVSTTATAATRPFGPGSLLLVDSGGTAGSPVFRALTFDVRNGAAIGGGGLCGLWIPDEELFLQISAAAAPFYDLRDAAGTAAFALGPGAPPPALAGRFLHGISLDFDPTTGAITACSNPYVVRL